MRGMCGVASAEICIIRIRRMAVIMMMLCAVMRACVVYIVGGMGMMRMPCM